MGTALLINLDVISICLVLALLPLSPVQTDGDVGYQYSHEMYEDMLTNEAAEGIKPTFDVPVANVTVIANQVALLPCSVNNIGVHGVAWTDENGEIAYTFKDERIVDDGRFSVIRSFIKDWHLEIRDVQPSDEGTYKCTVNTDPVSSKVVKLHVKVPAKIIDLLSSDDVTAREGDTVILICNVTGVPTPTVTWYRRPVNVMYRDDVERIGLTGEMVIITNITRYCDDIYECTADNGVLDSVSRQIRVTVEYIPEVTLTVDRLGQLRGKETVLECTINGFPLEATHWKKDGFIIGDKFTDRHTLHMYQHTPSVVLSLTIKDLQEEDFGEYTCYANNYMGHTQKTMVLYEDYIYKERPKVNVADIEEEESQQSQHTYQTEGQVIKKHHNEGEIIKVVPAESRSWTNRAPSSITTSRGELVYILLLLTVTLWTLYTQHIV